MKAAFPKNVMAPMMLVLALCSGTGVPAEEAPSSDVARSRRLREAVRAGLPKYEPKVDNDATMTDAGGLAVEQDGVLKLPDIQVRAKKQPRLRERDVRTSQAWVEKALKNAPGDKIGNIFGLNNGHAMAILTEELQVKEFNDLKDRVNQISVEASPDSKNLQRLIKDATTRTPAYWMGKSRP